MPKTLLALSIAALAISPAFAGHGGGGDHGGGGGHGAGGVEKHAGGGNAGGHGGRADMPARGSGGPSHGALAKAGHDNHMAARVERADRTPMRAEHQQRMLHHAERMTANDSLRHARHIKVANDIPQDRFVKANGLIDGCPPGLAAKHDGCLPPGQAKARIGTRLPEAYMRAMLSGPYADWYRDDERYLYRMGDYGIYRVDRSTDLISALIPSALSDFSYYPVGMNYPADYNYYNVPYQYRSYYPDGGASLYRYGDGAIYSVDPSSQAIQSIVALLAGDLGVGQRLPSSYGVYNVPLSYRDRYADTADDWYRYNDGYIYRVDPKTQLITAAISALV